MLNFVICDDNLKILDKFSKMLDNIFENHNFDAQVGLISADVETIIKYIDENKTDVLILDINLKSNKTGLEIAAHVREKNKNAYIIFTTAHLEYAMLAYKYKTFDYLPKPVSLERLEETIIRLFEDINGLPKKYIRIDSKNTIVDANEILYIKKDGMRVVFHTNSRDYETYSSFNKIKDLLPNNFVRCHKSYIANISNIANIDPVTNIIYFNNSPSHCDIGPKFKKDFMEVIHNDSIIE